MFPWLRNIRKNNVDIYQRVSVQLKIDTWANIMTTFFVNQKKFMLTTSSKCHELQAF